MKNMKNYDKLVRDKIPKIIKESGKKCKTRKMKPAEVQDYFQAKILEELEELFENPCAEEMGDVMEAVDCLRKALQLPIKDVIDVKHKKRDERGSFQKGIILLEVSD